MDKKTKRHEVGDRKDFLTLIEINGRSGGSRMGIFRCVCGKKIERHIGNVFNRARVNPVSCGCKLTRGLNPVRVKVDHQKQGPKEKNVRHRGSWRYWEKTVQRLSVFTDKDLKPGHSENGKIDILSRLDFYRAYKEFMKKYEGVEKEENRPFSFQHETEINRLLAGGLLINAPE